MFLLVSSRHVGAHPDGHQHGVSIQISIHFGKTFRALERETRVSPSRAPVFLAPTTSKRLQRRLNISPDISYTKDCSDLILVRVFVYLPPFVSQILDFIYWTVLLFISMDFEWRGTENQQLLLSIETFRFEDEKDFEYEIQFKVFSFILNQKYTPCKAS